MLHHRDLPRVVDVEAEVVLQRPAPVAHPAEGQRAVPDVRQATAAQHLHREVEEPAVAFAAADRRHGVRVAERLERHVGLDQVPVADPPRPQRREHVVPARREGRIERGLGQQPVDALVDLAHRDGGAVGEQQHHDLGLLADPRRDLVVRVFEGVFGEGLGVGQRRGPLDPLGAVLRAHRGDVRRVGRREVARHVAAVGRGQERVLAHGPPQQRPHVLARAAHAFVLADDEGDDHAGHPSGIRRAARFARAGHSGAVEA